MHYQRFKKYGDTNYVSPDKGFKSGKKNPMNDPAIKKQVSEKLTGRPLSLKHKKQLSRSMKQTLKDPIIKQKWVDAATGRKHSEEARKKMAALRALRPKTRKTLKSKLDVIFSRYIRLRDSKLVGGERVGKCITCNKLVGVVGQRTGQAGHFMSRRYTSTRWDEQNVNLQCAGCNMFGAGEQYKYSVALDEKYGPGTSKKLHDKSMMITKYSNFDLEMMIKIYEEKIKNIT